MKKQGPKKSSFFFLTIICAMAIIFWLTFLTVKVEEKEVLQKINDVAVGGMISFLYATMLFCCKSIDIAAEMMELKELKEKAEEETRTLLKIIEHYTQQENNQTAVSLDYFYLLILYIFSPGSFPEGGEGCYAK